MSRIYASIVRLNIVESYLKFLGFKVDWTLDYYEQTLAFINALDTLAKVMKVIPLSGKGWSRARTLYYRCVRASELLPF